MTTPSDREDGARMPGPTPVPPVTEALRAEARAHPGSWVYAVDPEFEGSGRVPPEGIVGAWRSDERGELTGEFTPNPRHVPSPAARGWPEPQSALERVLQLARAGHARAEQLDREFAASDVWVFARPEGGLFVGPDGGDGRVVSAFTDAGRAEAAGYPDHAVLRGDALAAALPDGVRIALNPGSEPSVVIDPADVPRG